MVQNIYGVLSKQQKMIYELHECEGKSLTEIAVICGLSTNTIKKHWQRVKKKISQLTAIENLEIDYGEELKDVFDEETNRMEGKKTINQVQFLANVDKMSTKGKSPANKRQMRKRLNMANSNYGVKTRKATEEELMKLKAVPEQMPDNWALRALQLYNLYYSDPPSIEYMAELEVVCRAAGLLYKTPYINKRNRIASMEMRAKGQGYIPVMVEPGEKALIPQQSKYLETERNEDGETEYSLWLFPENTIVRRTRGRGIC